MDWTDSPAVDAIFLFSNRKPNRWDEAVSVRAVELNSSQKQASRTRYVVVYSCDRFCARTHVCQLSLCVTIELAVSLRNLALCCDLFDSPGIAASTIFKLCVKSSPDNGKNSDIAMDDKHLKAIRITHFI
jgi:hypothetical protein